jgi:hypothetical protein
MIVAKIKLFIMLGVLLAFVCIVSGQQVKAGNTVVADDFSADSGLWNYLGDAERLPNGMLKLTSSAQGQVGTVWLKQTLSPPYVATFKYWMTSPGPSPYTKVTDGADGIVFMFNKQQNTSPISGGGMGFEVGNGYGVEFDTYSNVWDPASNHISLFKNNPNHLLGPVLGQVNDNSIENNQWHDVKIVVNTGSVQVYMDNILKVNYTGTLDSAYSGVGFTASTGYYFNTQYIDNIEVAKPAMAENVISAVPAGTYRIGDIIPVRIRFDDVVTVNPTAPPQLAMKTGKNAVYASGTGSNTLVFNYIVQAGDLINKLDYASVNALTGGITDRNGFSANKLLPVPGAAGSLSAQTSLNLATGSMLINAGEVWTASSNVTLQMTPAYSGAVQMSFSNNAGLTWSTWENYAASRSWLLPEGDGIKTVFVRFRNSAGAISPTFSDTIRQDLTRPAPPSYSANTTVFTNGNVTLSITYPEDANGNVSRQYKIGAGGTYTNYIGPLTITSNNTIYARSRDIAGNESLEVPFTISNIDKVAPSGSLMIHNGAALTKSTSVSLQINATDAGSGGIQMRFSNNNVAWSGWEALSAAKNWTLAAGDGSKTVYMQFKDNVGNTSGSFSDTVTLDTTAPAAAQFSPSTSAPTNGNITMAITYPGDAAIRQYKLSANGVYINYTSAFAISANGTVYARSHDAAGNISNEAIYTVSNIDQTPPVGGIVIQGGAIAINSSNVALHFNAADAGSGVTQMQLSSNGSTWGSLQPFVAILPNWSLDGADGVKTVYVRYKDAAGNVSGAFSDTILLDTNPPASPTFTTSPGGYTAGNVEVTISYSGDALIKQYKLGAGGVYAPYVAPLTLTTNQTVYARTQDAAGNWSIESSYALGLIDRTAPVGTLLINNGAVATSSRNVVLQHHAVDSGVGGIQMQLSDHGTSWGSQWDELSATSNWLLAGAEDGEKTVSVRYKDAVGNISPAVSSTITLDTVAPAGAILSASTNAYTKGSILVSIAYPADAAAASKQYKIGSGGSYLPYSGSVSLTVNDSVYARSADQAGNLSAETYLVVNNIDTIAPTGSIFINSGAQVTGNVYTSLNVTGSVYTSLNVVATDSGAGGIQMQFSNNGISWSGWEPLKPAKDWTLESGMGEKIVYARFKDSLNNMSSTVTGSVYYDPSILGATISSNVTSFTNGDITITIDYPASTSIRQYQYGSVSVTNAAYTNTFVITGNTTITTISGDGLNPSIESVYAVTNIDKQAPSAAISMIGLAEGAVTNRTSVTLQLESTDSGGSNGLQVQITDASMDWLPWESLTGSRTWLIPGGEGAKTVAARFKDAAGNVSSAVYSSLLYDSIAPSMSNDNLSASPAAWTHGAVTVTITYPGDAAIMEVKLGADGNYTAYSSPIQVTANDTVYARAQDAAGNWSSEGQIVVANIEKQPPNGTLQINGGAGLTNQQQVTLQLSASDGAGSGGIEMHFSNDPDSWGTADWIPFASTASWTVTNDDGYKTVYVQYRDAAGNITTERIQGGIILDMTGPTLPLLAVDKLLYTVESVKVSIQYPEDAVVRQFKLGAAGSFAAYTGTIELTENETVYAKAQDAAGNWSAEAALTVSNIDKTAPQNGSIQINGGAIFTNRPDVVLQLSAADSESGVAGMRFSVNGVDWDAWFDFAPMNNWTYTKSDWILPAGDVTSSVYVQFRDAAGNESNGTATSASITLDTIGPVWPTFTVSESVYTSNDVILTIAYPSDANPASLEYMLGSAGNYNSYEGPITLTVNDAVYARSQDLLGNASGLAFFKVDNIDKLGPTGAIQIDGNATDAASYDVVLQLMAVDSGVGGIQMQLSNDGTNWSDWEPFTSIRSWRLNPGEGTKSVMVRYKDSLDNVSLAFSDSIVIQGDFVAVAEAKEALVESSLRLGNATLSDVRTALGLPLAGTGGTLISWESNSPSVNADGSIVRPPFTGQNETVVLTATISKNSATTTKTFEITVLKYEVSDEATLSRLIPSEGQLSPSFAPDLFSYNMLLSKHTMGIELRPTLTSSSAAIFINPSATEAVYSNGIITVPALNMGFNEISIKVQAEDGASSHDYVITLFKASDEKNILSFSLSGQVAPAVIDADAGTVTATVAFASDRTGRTAQFNLSDGATANMNENEVKNYTAPVTITVTAQDGTKRAWTIVLQDAPAALETPIPVRSDSPIPFANGVVVDFRGQVIPAGATLQVVGLEPALGGTGLVRAGSAIDFQLSGMVLSGSNYAELTLPLFPDLDTANVAIFKYEGNRWQKLASQLAGNSVAAAVYASSKYGVFIDNRSHSNDIVSFSLSGQVARAEINAEEGTVTITVAYGSDRTQRSVQVGLSEGATINLNQDEVKDFSTPVILTVTAQDGTQRLWTIKLQDAAAEMQTPIPVRSDVPLSFANGARLNFNGMLISPGTVMLVKDVEPVIEEGAGLTASGAIVDFELTGMTLTEPVELALPFYSGVDTSRLAIFYYNNSRWELLPSRVVGNTVVALVHHFSTYGVLTDNRSNDARLSEVTVQEGTLAETFAAEQQVYTIYADGATSSLIVKPAVSEEHANYIVTGASYTTTNEGIRIQLDGSTSFNIIVTAQNAITTRTYTFHVNQKLAFAAANEQGTSIQLMFKERLSQQSLATLAASSFALSGTNATITEAKQVAFTSGGSLVLLRLSEPIQLSALAQMHLSFSGLSTAANVQISGAAIPVLAPQRMQSLRTQLDLSGDGIGIDDIVKWQGAQSDVTLDQRVDVYDLLLLLLQLPGKRILSSD